MSKVAFATLLDDSVSYQIDGFGVTAHHVNNR